MVFSSLLFLTVFLPVVLGVHFILPARARNAWLLLSSLTFYAWGELHYLWVMLLSISVNYVAGIAMAKLKAPSARLTAIILCVATNLGLLVFFKYANFLIENLGNLFGWTGEIPPEYLAIHLPIGISFFTFQAMSYSIDVYRKEVDAQRNPLSLALYISLFPQLIAGPIVRYQEIAADLVKRTVSSDMVAYGTRRFIIGLAKKVLIANTLAIPADAAFGGDMASLTTSMAWLGAVCYMLQIYFDFSGYSDMAIGLGAIFGFKFGENFNSPYVSRSITEFWRRWHISLSTWFRDYLYIPLGGNRKGVMRTFFNLATVFLLCGLWHGAEWTFILWGAFHGGLLIVERLGFSKLLKSLPGLSNCFTLLAVLVGWVLFRSDSLDQAFHFLRVMRGSTSAHGFVTSASYLNIETVACLVIGVLASIPIGKVVLNRFSLIMSERQPGNPGLVACVQGAFSIIQYAIFVSLLLLCMTRLAAGTFNPFIYFRF